MSAVPVYRLAASAQVVCGIILSAWFASLCGCVPACDGTYTVDANYANTDTDNIHIFVSEKETFAPSNRIAPGDARRAQYRGSFFEPIYTNPLLSPTGGAAQDACDDAKDEADESPQTWTFQAGRNGQVLASQTVTIQYVDVAGGSRTYAVNVFWNGTTLTVTKR